MSNNHRVGCAPTASRHRDDGWRILPPRPPLAGTYQGSRVITWPLRRWGEGRWAVVGRGVILVCVCCGICAMELRRRIREGETTTNAEASDGDNTTTGVDVDRSGSSEAAADAVVGAAVRGGSLLMLLALIQVGADGCTQLRASKTAVDQLRHDWIGREIYLTVICAYATLHILSSNTSSPPRTQGLWLPLLLDDVKTRRYYRLDMCQPCQRWEKSGVFGSHAPPLFF